MGTEVLRPQDCLAERFQISPSTFHHARKNSNDSGNWQNSHFNHNIINNNYGYRKPAQVRTDPKRRCHHQDISISIPPRLPYFDNVKAMSKHTKNNNQNNEFYCNNGRDSILRRGASLDSLNQKIKRDYNNNKMRNKARISSHLADLEVPVRFGFPESMYAGSAFSVSPHPSDLPLPTFFRKRSFDDDSEATRGLRRLLRLE